VPPPSSLADPVVTATTKPVLHAPDPLPVPPPIKAAPLPQPPDPLQYGDPNSASLVPSDGPGDGGGAGNGKGGGWGPGGGPGAGPGRDGGRNGGEFTPGGPGGAPAPALAQKARILNNPRPEYTELARTNKTQGVVQVRVLLGADGRVRRAEVSRGLPDGLDSKAIEAVYRLRFEPARDAKGDSMDSWVTVSVTFTIR
jgi:TonB family protein